MIILSENFDQVKDTADLDELYGYEGIIGDGGTYPPMVIAPSDEFFNAETSTPLELGDQHKQSLYGYKQTNNQFSTPLLPDSRRLVFGISVGGLQMRDGVADVIAGGDMPFMKWTKMDIKFGNGIISMWGDGNVLFMISVYYRKNGTIDIHYDNMDATLTAIAPDEGIPINKFRKNFLEFYSDSTGAESNNGTVKVALNGVTIVTKENVVNSKYTEWAGNPSDPGSYYNNVAVKFRFHTLDYYQAYYSSVNWLIDHFYICNEDGGYHDDFLGPVHITTMYPDPEQTGDVNNWVGYKNQVKADPLVDPNASLVNSPALDFTEAAQDYIEADAELLQELYYMKNDIAPGPIGLNNPIAVNFTTFIKHIFSYDSEDFDKGLVALTKPSGNIISRETSGKISVDQHTYKPLDLYYGVVPNLAVAWTWEMLDGMQFGFESTQLVHQLFLDESIGLSEIATEA